MCGVTRVGGGASGAITAGREWVYTLYHVTYIILVRNVIDFSKQLLHKIIDHPVRSRNGRTSQARRSESTVLQEPGENHPVSHVEHGKQQREEHPRKPVDVYGSGAVSLCDGRRGGCCGRGGLRGRSRRRW